MRALVPQAVTSLRIVFGAAALVAAEDGRLADAAMYITFGTVADGLDGLAARLLHASSRFGALFDYFADYLCSVIAPWVLARGLIAQPVGATRELLLVLPVVTGAIRYARNGLRISAPAEDAVDLPGLGTVFFSFLIVTSVYLDAPARLGQSLFPAVLTSAVALLSVLMLVPIQYPKLVRFAGAGPVVLVALTVMPFVWTTALAGATFAGGLLYAVVAPLFAIRAGLPRDVEDTPDNRVGG
jgi:CDP-diacylglycerol--serine O-phosphatidyltransferase